MEINKSCGSSYYCGDIHVIMADGTTSASKTDDNIGVVNIFLAFKILFNAFDPIWIMKMVQANPLYVAAKLFGSS
ncbi:MAG: hypothetical protein ACI9RO_001551 [Alteromonas macleodii]|jgi:hypothetical protein